jgi:hypothetical protein
MGERHVLQMLQEGQISTEEALRLLQALNPDAETASVDTSTSSPSALESATLVPPDMEHFRRYGQISFAISLSVVVVSGWGLYALNRQADGRITAGWVLVLVLCILALLASAITAWMMMTPWLHVRIRRREGRPIAISLPLPLSLGKWGIRLARRFVDDSTAEYLDAAAEFLTLLKQSQGQSDATPLLVSVDDEDESVQVYLG